MTWDWALLPTKIMFFVPAFSMMACLVVAIIESRANNRKKAFLAWVLFAALLLVTTHYAAAEGIGLITVATANTVFYLFAVSVTLASLVYLFFKIKEIRKSTNNLSSRRADDE